MDLSGDVFRAVGLVTAYGLTEPISHFEMTVLEVFNDNFAKLEFWSNGLY